MNQDQDMERMELRFRLLGFICTAVIALSLSAQVASAEDQEAVRGTQRFDQQMEPILRSYLKVGESLAADSLDGVRSEAERITKLAVTLDPKSVTGQHAAHYKNVPIELKTAAQTLGEAKTLDEARDAYKKLSMPMGMWASMSKPKDVNVVYCSMAKASWLQKGGEPRNPYYGPKMLKCGEVVGGKDASQSPM